MKYKSLLSTLQFIQDIIPEYYLPLFLAFVFTFIIVIYSIFSWKLYRFLSKKDLFDLSIKHKNYYSTTSKIVYSLIYIFEYIFLSPLAIFLGFFIFAFMILLMSEQPVAVVLLIGASFIAATRVTAYISESISEQLANLLPFTLLFYAIVYPEFFTLSVFLERISQIPSFINQIIVYIFFIIILEGILRIISVLITLIYSPQPTLEELE